jgi:glycosyltransferase involved in cell wall biosynthesis
MNQQDVETIGASAAAAESQSERLRSLLVIPKGSVVSSYIFSRRQAEVLRRAGVESRMFFLESRISPRLIAAELARLRRTIRQFHPHVVHAQYGSMTAFLAMVAGGAPLVVTFRGSDLNPVPSCNPARIWMGHLLSQIVSVRARAAICVSAGLRERFWWAKQNAFVIPGGVDLELFQPFPRHEARAILGWEDDAPIVLFNAGAHPKVKRLDLAESAIDAARRARPEIRFIVLRGDVDPDTMPICYNAADCLLITSDYEGSPTALKEALACNLPVVSVEVGDAMERLRGVSRSMMVGREPSSIASALLQILETRERSNGRETVLRLSEYAEAERIRDIYSVVAGRDVIVPL